MPVSDKAHFDALREADQRAVQLLAQANAAKASNIILVASLLVSVASVLVAISAIIFHH